MERSYEELIKIPDFLDRFRYLNLTGRVGETTFGGHRQLNQALYKMPEWRRLRNIVIDRDNGCDLAHADHEIRGRAAYIHHINPITIEDIQNRNPLVLDPNNLITTSFNTHQAIHFGDESLLPHDPVERRPGDTCPWKRGGPNEREYR